RPAGTRNTPTMARDTRRSSTGSFAPPSTRPRTAPATACAGASRPLPATTTSSSARPSFRFWAAWLPARALRWARDPALLPPHKEPRHAESQRSTQREAVFQRWPAPLEIAPGVLCQLSLEYGERALMEHTMNEYVVYIVASPSRTIYI